MLHDQKRRQAQALLDPGDLWMTVARESMQRPEPALSLVAGVNVTWDSLFLLTHDDAVAIVGRFDADAVPEGWRVRTYDADLSGVLNEEMTRLNPRRVLVNTSEHDPLSDGLTVGLQQKLRAWLPDRELDSAETLLGTLRSVKSPEEHQAILDAVQVTERHLHDLRRTVKPGWTETDVLQYLHGRCRADGVEPAWGWPTCPNVHIGPHARPSHGPAGQHSLGPGMLLHIDYGVRLPHGYSADLQRTYYQPFETEGLSAPVEDAFRACWNALQAGADALRPGAAGHEVDAAARRALMRAGYPEYQHALGHALGRATHDGGTLLGPRWPRYGRAVEGIVRAGEVYTLELGTFVEGHGFIGLEEDVIVWDGGLTWLSQRQDDLYLLGVT